MAEELADIEDWLCMESEEWRLWLDIEEEGFCLTWLATTRLFKAATTGTKVKAWSRRGLRGAWVKFCQRESLCQHFTSSYYPTVTDLFWVRYWDFIFFFFKWRMRECYEITAHEMLMDGAGTKHSVCLSTGRTEGLIWASLALGEFRGEAIWGLFLQEFSQDKSVWEWKGPGSEGTACAKQCK